MKKIEKNYIYKYIIKLQSTGKYTFTFDELKKKFNALNCNALKKSLSRLIIDKKILSARKGFYVIIPPEYLNSGTLPPILFVDDLMKSINRNYYVGMLNSALFYGAGHQQPQELFVITDKPAIRDIKKKNISIKFITRKKLLIEGITEQKTDTGYVKISLPELTMIDLIQFQRKAGGLNRIVSIITEMKDKIDKKRLSELLTNNDIPCSVLQRLGYILESFLSVKDVSDSLYLTVKRYINRRTALNPFKKIKGFSSDNRWKVIINTGVEIEE